jgi:hypothetical protein
MGLLDDAIREHLELKRRRGADPGEVAREQHEALDDPLDPAVERIEDPSSLGSVSAPELATPPTAPNLLEETAELDMRTVLDQRADSANVKEDSANVKEMSAGSTGAALPVDSVPEAAAGEEPLEWEAPEEAMHEHASQTARPEADPREAVTAEGVEHVHPPAEDPVAEITDLPREVSEQDRVWLDRNAARHIEPDK